MNQVLVSVKTFGRESFDVNGKQAVILIPVAGKIPNRNTIAGTVAEREGLEIGKTYLVSFREVESNEYGRQFQWSKIACVENPLHIIEASKSLGEASIYDVSKATSVAKQEVPAGDHDDLPA